MKNILIYSLAVVLLTNCNTNEKETNQNLLIKSDVFPDIRLLEGEPIIQDNRFKLGEISILDSLIMIYAYDDTIHYYIYGKKSQNLLGSLGTVGDGPDDWQVVFHSHQFELSKEGIMLWFSGNRRGFLSKVNLSKVIQAKSPKPVIEKSIRVDSKKFPFNQLFYVSDDKLIGNSGYYEEERVRIKSYNPQTQEIKKVGLFPKIKNAQEFPSPVLYNFYFGAFKKHPSKNIFVQTLRVMNRIDIFDENLNLQRSIVGGKNWQDDFFDAKKIDIEKDYMTPIVEGYASASVSENFIFALSATKKINETTKEVQKSFIKVFDWNGNPKCLLEVKDDLFSISVDAQEGYLYATDPKHEKILRYNIQELAKKWKR